jgi:hypothetical protein
MNSIIIGFVILGVMTVAVLIFIVTNAGKEAARARQKREASAPTGPEHPTSSQTDDRETQDT